MIKNEIICNFVLVNYNNSEISLACVSSVCKMNSKSKILVVDNNSKEEERKILNPNDKSYDLIFLKENIGYAGALNKGIDYLYDLYGENQIIVVGNNDLIYSKNFANLLLQSLYDENVMIVSPNIIKCGSNIHQNPYRINNFSKIDYLKYDIFYSNFYLSKLILSVFRCFNILKSEKDKDNHTRSMNIKMGHGACYVLLPSFLKICRRLDSPLFLYGEELFISLQVEDNKGIIYYDSNLIVHHDEHSTTGSSMSKWKFKYLKEAYKKYKSIIKSR